MLQKFLNFRLALALTKRVSQWLRRFCSARAIAKRQGS